MTEYLDEIQARADAATDGPWLVVHEPEREEGNCTIPDVIYVASSDVPDGFEVCRVSTDHEDDPVAVLADAEFIAHARTDVPRLVAEQRDLIRLLDAAREDKTKARRQRSEYRLRAMRAEAALRAVEALHQPRTVVTSGSSNPDHVPTTVAVCRHCSTGGYWPGVAHPCPTVTAVRDALDPT